MRTSGRFQWDSIQSLAISGRKITALTGLSAVLILASAPFYDDRRFWLDGEEPVSDAQWDDISKALGQMELEVMQGMIGLILPHVLGSLVDISMLPCDGAAYLREDYPLLYEAIDPVYHIDADNFRVPDLRDKFPMSAGVDFSLDDTGGETEHTLTEDEIPSHSHENIPHSHSEIIAVPALGEISPGVPFPSATPSASVTGLADVEILPTGGGEAHNNMPPYIALHWAIVCD